MTEKDLPSKMNRDFKGIWIPREIWLAEGLSATEKVLWAEIHSLYNEEKDGCYASNDYLAKFMAVKERTVRDALFKFRQLKLIQDVSFNGRERVIKALQPDNEFNDRLAEWRKTAMQGGENPPVCPAENRNPHIYIDTSIVTSINTPPIPPLSEPAGAVAAKAAEEIPKDSQKEKPKKPREPSAFAPKVKQVGQEMLSTLVACNPVYRPPDNLEKFFQQVELMLEKDKQDVSVILRTFRWACEDSEQRDNFKGWQSVVCTNKRKGKASNPAEIFRSHFSTIYSQMNSQPKRKFAPSSNDARGLEKMLEWEKGAL